MSSTIYKWAREVAAECVEYQEAKYILRIDKDHLIALAWAFSELALDRSRWGSHPEPAEMFDSDGPPMGNRGGEVMADFTRREVTHRRIEYRLRAEVPCGELAKAIHVARREVEELYPERAGYADAVMVTVNDDEIVLYFNCEQVSTGL